VTPETSSPWWAHTTPTPPAPQRARRWNWRATARGALAFVVIVGAASLVLTAGGPPKERKITADITETPGSVEALIGGCGGVFTQTFPAGQVGTVPALTPTGEPYTLPYLTIVPMGGKMWPTGWSEDRLVVAPEEIRTASRLPYAEEVVRNLWDGWLVVYYRPGAPQGSVQTAIEQATRFPEQKIMVLPWPEDLRNSFPKNRKFALAVWGQSQTCDVFVPPLVTQMRERNPVDQAPGYGGVKPPVLLDRWPGGDGATTVPDPDPFRNPTPTVTDPGAPQVTGGPVVTPSPVEQESTAERT
jgi:Protein of unknown function (DUF3105)